MNNVKQKKVKKIKSILQYILIICLIIECNSVYSQIYKYHYYIRGGLIITIIGLIITLLIPQIKNKKIKYNKSLIFIIFYIIIVSLIMVIKTKSYNGLIITILNFGLFFPLSLIYIISLTKEEIKDLLIKFVKIVLAISIISLFFWLFGSVLNIIKPTNEIKIVWGRPYTTIDNYIYIYFDSKQVQMWLTKFPLVRNMGIFGESPMYAFILLSALLINNTICFRNRKENYIVSLIILITIISTISVTGIICSIIILLIKTKDILNYKAINKIKIIIPIILILFIPIFIFFISKKMKATSSINRTHDLINGINSFIKDPIIGKGINHQRDFEDNPINGYGYSNTIIPILTDGGILLFLLYITPIIFIIKNIFNYKKNIIEDICIIFIYITILLTTAVQYRLLLILEIVILYNKSLNIQLGKGEN